MEYHDLCDYGPTGASPHTPPHSSILSSFGLNYILTAMRAVIQRVISASVAGAIMDFNSSTLILYSRWHDHILDRQRPTRFDRHRPL
jgi:hypothetical protein